MSLRAGEAQADSGVALVETEAREVDDRGRLVAIIRFNRPEQLNAISWETQRELARALGEAEVDPLVRCVLITGKGRAFSAGGDIRAYVELQRDPAAFTQFVDEYCRLTEGIRAMTKPVIALVNGICAAGGLELLLACDFAWAAKSARIGDLHINFAQIGGAGVLTRLPRLVGTGRALELFFSGRLLDSGEALSWGVVNRVIADNDLLDEAVQFARMVASKSPAAVHYMKKTVAAGLATDFQSALRLERDNALEYCLTLPDSMEGIHAFVEKRAPTYGAAT